ncbi:MAG: prolipoprotein diacylglyceryl transferase [Flavobacteriaceae bacterium]|nr:prolipoprotein diacylglyceryl transferase [Flavobacteriaceae bacterium]
MYALDFIWDPSSEGINLFGKFTIHYYSLMWILAFTIGWYIMKQVYKKESLSEESLDSLFMYTILGTIIGARLGHVIFYQAELFQQDFLSVFLPFKFNPTFEFTGFRGLASHGAAIGIIISMYLYNKNVIKKSFLWILDRIVLAVPVGGAFIRLGNFFNSEIVGNKTTSSFGVIFKALGENEARHPAQLYEAFGYILIFVIIYYVFWKTSKVSKPGYIFGLFFVLLWSTRFIIEFFKEAQVSGREDWIFGMNTGQTLSIPFIFIGLYLMKRK